MALLLVTMVAALSPSPVLAQGGATSTLQGIVKDSSGAVVPGADIVAKDKSTGTVFSAVSGANGGFAIPSIPPGTYTVTVALMGFKTSVLNNVNVTAADPATVTAVLELGKLEETVIVEGATQMVQTQSASVTSTLNVKQIANLPLVGRGAFDFVAQMPGVNTSTGSSRDAIVNGLPQASVNITLDGMNIQDNYAKSWDGMFTRVSPRLDAVEELSISSAASNAADAGQGGVQVRFVTRSGTNQFRGSLYYYLRMDALNTNTWFNMHRNVSADGTPTAKPVVKQYQPGGRVGGPIWKDKAFFFVNYEWISSPGTSTLRPTVMSPLSEQGIFQYVVGGVAQTPVNLMTLAASKGNMSTIDPLIAKTMAAMRASMSQGNLNATTDPLTQEFVWQMATKSTTKYPTVRLDYNVTSKHRLSFTTTYNHLISDPDTTNGYYAQYPGFPNHGTQDSVRYSGQLNLRSVLTANMVNEFRVGATGGATQFFPSDSADMFTDYNGYALGMSTFKGIANPYSTASNSAREGSTRVIEDTVSWLRGKHSVSAGANVTRADVWLDNQQYVPTVGLGIATGDPADAMFTTANFPSASSTDLTNARNLYAVLTGRVSSLGRNARIAEDGTTYVILGPSKQKGRMWDLGFHLQDSWRATPNLTLNAGVRYALQLPFQALNNSYSSADMAAIMGISGTGTDFKPGSTVTGIGNLFKPGTIQGAVPTFSMLTANTNGYNVDKNNLAPSVGVAWTLGASSGLLHTLIGSPGDSVLRAGYGVSYQRPGMSDFTGVYGSLPGVSIDATRSLQNGNLGTLPLLLGGSDLGPPAINLTRTYPMPVPSASTSVYAFDPNIQTPWSSSLTVGMQRAITKTTMVEARFVHTYSAGEWTNSNLHGYLNYNEINVNENGFANEFRVAQANLQANILAGKGNTFAYTGAAGTNPLPIFLANINGSAAATDTTKYTGTGWTNTTLVSYLYPLNPNVLSAASNLRGNATYKANALAAGLVPNFFVANPDVSSAYVQTNGASTSYNGIQLIARRRFSAGLQVDANYSFGVGNQGVFYSFHVPYVNREQTYNNSVAGGPVNHMLRANWVYELPFGQGKRLGRNAGGALNRVIGNWTWSGTLQLQSGRRVDFGNVRLVGFTKDELQGALSLRQVTDPNNQFRTLVYFLPQDIIDNTIKAFSLNATGYSAGTPTGRYFAPANGPDCLETYSNSYGKCGAGSVIITGPKVFRVDMSLIKEVPIVRSVVFRFEAMLFNVFNTVNFTPGSYTGATSDSYQVTGAVDQSRTMQLAFRITW
jgi:hypothetical protein